MDIIGNLTERHLLHPFSGTGIFAGIYYQHYRIPKEYLTNNRYYGKFSASIIPLEHEVYDTYESFSQDEKDCFL